MTVHQVINDYNLANGGAQRLAIEIHRGCLDAGLSSRLLGLSKDPNYRLEYATSFKCSNVYNFKSILQMWHYFRKEVSNGDIVHVHLFPATLYVCVLKRLGLIPRCKLFLTEHNTNNRRRNVWLGKIIDIFIYHSFEKIITISDGVNEVLIDYLPNLKSKLFRIKNGAHLPFNEVVKRVKKKSPIVLSIGRLHAQKNYEAALRSISQLKHLDFEYWIAGTGEMKKDLTNLAHQLGIDDKVTFLGYVEDIPELLQKCDIYLITSEWEGFGLAAVEAMNASLPSIVSKVNGLKDLVAEDGHDAFLVDPADCNGIAKYLEMLIESSSLRLGMGTRAFYRSMSFGINSMTENYINLYKEDIIER